MGRIVEDGSKYPFKLRHFEAFWQLWMRLGGFEYNLRMMNGPEDWIGGLDGRSDGFDDRWCIGCEHMDLKMDDED